MNTEERFKSLEEILFAEYDKLLREKEELFEQAMDSSGSEALTRYRCKIEAANMLWNILSKVNLLGDYVGWLERTDG